MYPETSAAFDRGLKSVRVWLFLAPGVQHCGGGAGPAPDNPLAALVDWVEHGRAPNALNGVRRDSTGTVVQTRPICLYPEVATYRGHGDITAAASFTCRRPHIPSE